MGPRFALAMLMLLGACRSASELGPLGGGPHPDPPGDDDVQAGSDGPIGQAPLQGAPGPATRSPNDESGPADEPAQGDPAPSGMQMQAGAAGMADPQSPVDMEGMEPTAPAEPIPATACSDDLSEPLGSAHPDIPTPSAPSTLASDPVLDGPYAVRQQDVTIDNPHADRAALTGTFYVPASAQGDSLTGPLPLLLVMPGFATNHLLYEHFSTHLASHGLLVLGLTLPLDLAAAHDQNAQEAIAAIDYALGDRAPALVAGRADPERIAVAGHSLGGKIAFYAAALDPRIDMVIGWDPSNAGGPPCSIAPDMCNDFPVAPNCMAMDSGLLHRMQAESLVFRAAPDAANPEPAHNAIHFYRGAPAPATLVDFDRNAAHGDWANPTTVVIEHTKRVQLAFLLKRFLGTTGLDGYLPGGAQIGADPAVVRVLSKAP